MDIDWDFIEVVSKGPINNILALVEIMAWCRKGDKPLSEPTRKVWLHSSQGLDNFGMLKFAFSISLDITRLVQPIPPMLSQENAPKLQIWLVSLSKYTAKLREINRPRSKVSSWNPKPQIWSVSLSLNDAKMRKINRPWPQFNKFWRWWGYINMPKFRPFLPCVLQKRSGICKFGLFH